MTDRGVLISGNDASVDAQAPLAPFDSRLPSSQLLDRLKDPATTQADRRQTILDAEVSAFSDADRVELCGELREYIRANRESDCRQDLVAVASAIRKLVAYLPSEQLGDLAELLMPSSRLPIPIEVELEVAKTIVRKLSAHPPITDDPEPALGERLFELAATYVNPRLLPREKHGATAINAVIALLLLRSKHASEAMDLVEEASTRWFTELACRRTAQLTAEIRARLSPEAFLAATHMLTEFAARFGLQNA